MGKKNNKLKHKPKQLIKLSLSHGSTPDGKDAEDGFIRARLRDLEDESVEEIVCAYLLQRIPGENRPAFMDECYRVLVPGGKMTVIVPYYSSARASQDFTAEWPPLSEHSFNYFNKGWRDAQKYDQPHHCGEFLALDRNPVVKCDFDFTGGYIFDPDVQGKADDVRSRMVKNSLNSVSDLQIVLTKKV